MNNLFMEEYPIHLKAIPLPIKQSLCNDLNKIGFDVISDKKGMIMMSTVDCFDTAFHLGEISVREIKVEIQNQSGIGTVIGDCFEDAFIVACACAADTAGNTEIAGMIENVICENKHFRDDAEMIDRGVADKTKVNFGLMVAG